MEWNQGENNWLKFSSNKTERPNAILLHTFECMLVEEMTVCIRFIHSYAFLCVWFLFLFEWGNFLRIFLQLNGLNGFHVKKWPVALTWCRTLYTESCIQFDRALLEMMNEAPAAISWSVSRHKYRKLYRVCINMAKILFFSLSLFVTLLLISLFSWVTLVCMWLYINTLSNR